MRLSLSVDSLCTLVRIWVTGNDDKLPHNLQWVLGGTVWDSFASSNVPTTIGGGVLHLCDRGVITATDLRRPLSTCPCATGRSANRACVFLNGFVLSQPPS